MIEFAKKNPKLGIVGGKILDRNGKPEKSAGNFYSLFRTLLFVLGLDRVFIRFSPKKPLLVDFVSGGFMLIRRRVFEGLLGFDEDFFMYFEDVDFCARAKKKGFDTAFYPFVFVRHFGQASSDRAFAIVNIYKGFLLFHKKHSGKFSLFLVKLLLKAKALFLLAFAYIFGFKKLFLNYSRAYQAI
jgi:hypothetical protein